MADDNTADPLVDGREIGGRIDGHAMRQVDHYDRAQVLMPNGRMMCSYTPVFATDDDREATP
ncbi:hypothetical protein [Rhodococcoides fascians]|uniref:hypothetical protein n=1 Tax=Rhodococcoides fascians TaxID=1828 RepID=UPI00050C2480|nr:hypothetical protein [Rhodococcus fascians]